MTDTEIVAFITARLDEDQARAEAAGGDRWAYDLDGEVYRPDKTRHVRLAGGYVSEECAYVTCDSEGLTPSVDRAEGRHIADEDPAATLRRCVMVRALMRHAEHANSMDEQLGEEGYRRPDGPTLGEQMWHDIAAYWNQHADYRSEWTPTA